MDRKGHQPPKKPWARKIVNSIWPISTPRYSPFPSPERRFVSLVLSGGSIEEANRFAACFKKIIDSSSIDDRARADLRIEVVLTLMRAFSSYKERTAENLLGETTESYLRMAKEVDQFANRITRVNGAVLGSPVKLLLRTSTNVREGDLVAEMASLPDLLRKYAEMLRSRTKLGLKTKGKRGARHLRLATDGEVVLVRLVKGKTGKPHMEECAVLLKAVYSLLPALGKRTFSAEALAARFREFEKRGDEPAQIDFLQVLYEVSNLVGSQIDEPNWPQGDQPDGTERRRVSVWDYDPNQPPKFLGNRPE